MQPPENRGVTPERQEKPANPQLILNAGNNDHSALEAHAGAREREQKETKETKKDQILVYRCYSHLLGSSFVPFVSLVFKIFFVCILAATFRHRIRLNSRIER